MAPAAPHPLRTRRVVERGDAARPLLLRDVSCHRRQVARGAGAPLLQPRQGSSDDVSRRDPLSKQRRVTVALHFDNPVKNNAADGGKKARGAERSRVWRHGGGYYFTTLARRSTSCCVLCAPPRCAGVVVATRHCCQARADGVPPSTPASGEADMCAAASEQRVPSCRTATVTICYLERFVFS